MKFLDSVVPCEFEITCSNSLCRNKAIINGSLSLETEGIEIRRIPDRISVVVYKVMNLPSGWKEDYDNYWCPLCGTGEIK